MPTSTSTRLPPTGPTAPAHGAADHRRQPVRRPAGRIAAGAGLRRAHHPARRGGPPALPASGAVQGVPAGHGGKRVADLPLQRVLGRAQRRPGQGRADHADREGSRTAPAWPTRPPARQFPFDRLALTVGARARKLQVPGADLDGVVYLRNADDALELKARVGRVQDVVVIGGGFIGLEAASSLRKMGKNVTVLEYGPAAGRPGRGRGDRGVLPRTRTATRPGHPARCPDRAGSRGRRGGTRWPASSSRTAPCCPRRSCWSGSASIPEHRAGRTARAWRWTTGSWWTGYALASDGTTVAVGDVRQHAQPGARVAAEGNGSGWKA